MTNNEKLMRPNKERLMTDKERIANFCYQRYRNGRASFGDVYHSCSAMIEEQFNRSRAFNPVTTLHDMVLSYEDWIVLNNNELGYIEDVLHYISPGWAREFYEEEVRLYYDSIEE